MLRDRSLSTSRLSVSLGGAGQGSSAQPTRLAALDLFQVHWLYTRHCVLFPAESF
eukprot:COSAG05_NODE_49_length_24373_cov_16.162561_15_plen_55_part_00